VIADEHPQLVIAHLKAMIKVGRWANEHKHAAAVILNRQTFYRDVEDTYEGIKHVDMAPNLSPQNLAAITSARTSCGSVALCGVRHAELGPLVDDEARQDHFVASFTLC